MSRAALRNLVLLWLAWAIILSTFQFLVKNRFQVVKPDFALDWTASLTGPRSQNDKPYLIDPFMNDKVSFDSIFYISIALVGYDDPVAPLVRGDDGTTLSMNYAFFPFYSVMMRIFMVPLGWLSETPIATATLAGVVVSLLGTLVAMLALYDLTVDELNEKGALRTAFYLLIFPTGFFLGTVFTEGLFVGMAFGSLALARRKKYLWAGLLVAAAALTRAVGVFLVVPLAVAILLEEWPALRGRAWHKRMLPEAAGILLPLAAMGTWYLSPLAAKFRYVEENYFGQGFLQIGASWQAWKEAFRTMVSWTNPQTSAYYLIEFGCIVLALLSALFILKKYPWVALFSLLALLIPLTSGAPQSLNRYVLACPSIFIFLSRMGKNEIFDRLWTTASILVMGMLLTLFTYDMWVA